MPSLAMCRAFAVGGHIIRPIKTRAGKLPGGVRIVGFGVKPGAGGLIGLFRPFGKLGGRRRRRVNLRARARVGRRQHRQIRQQDRPGGLRRKPLTRGGAKCRPGRGLSPPELGVANIKARIIVYGLGEVKLETCPFACWCWPPFCPWAGCGGISASRGVSPLDFLLPGGFLLQNDPRHRRPTISVTPTQPYRQVALAK